MWVRDIDSGAYAERLWPSRPSLGAPGRHVPRSSREPPPVPRKRAGPADDRRSAPPVTDRQATAHGGPIRRVLGIETSCDETAAAVVEDGTTIVSSVVSSQIDLHARYGGVVPELAGRAHVELLTPVLADALDQAGSDHTGRGIDGIAVTHGPGLIGSLLVGVAEAKALSMAWGVPLVGVNHLEAHLFASLLEQPDLGWPLVVLLVSGGHTLLIEVTASRGVPAAGRHHRRRRRRGLRQGGPVHRPRLPRRPGHRPDRRPRGTRPPSPSPGRCPATATTSSFSGLKTSVVNRVRKEPERRRRPTWPRRSRRRWSTCWSPGPAGRPPTSGARALCLAGGVAANSLLRPGSSEACAEDGIGAFLPSRALCTDNAAMVAAAGHWRLDPGGPQPARPGRRPQPAPGLDRLSRPGRRPGRRLALAGRGCQAGSGRVSLALSTFDC